jgi:hypothetical protein
MHLRFNFKALKIKIIALYQYLLISGSNASLYGAVSVSSTIRTYCLLVTHWFPSFSKILLAPDVKLNMIMVIIVII